MKSEIRELLSIISLAYAGRPTITLDEFLRDFTVGTHGQPMKRKTARNQIYAGRFPVPVINERILIIDIAGWMYQVRTKYV